MSKLFECIDVSKTFTIDKSPIEALKKVNFDNSTNLQKNNHRQKLEYS